MNLNTIELDAAELLEPTVLRISIVDRGANRSPIRKLKSEDSMKNSLDLSNLQGLLVQKAATAAVEQEVVAAIITLKGDECESFKAGLADEGIYFAKSFETEVGTTLIVDESADLTDVEKFSTVQISGDVAVVVKGFSPWGAASNPATPFEEAMKAQGFYSSFYGATELLMSRMERLSDDVRTKSQFMAEMQPLVAGFSAYLDNLAEALPDTAFKMAVKAAELAPAEVVEPVEPVVVESEPAVEPEATDAPQADEPKVEDDAETQTVETAEEPQAEPVAEAEPSVVADEAADEPADEPVVDAAPEPVVTEKSADEAELTGLEKIMAAVNNLSKSQEETFAKMSERLDKVETTASKSAKRTTGAVATSPPAAPKESAPVVQKDASLNRPIDTAYRSVSNR